MRGGLSLRGGGSLPRLHATTTAAYSAFTAPPLDTCPPFSPPGRRQSLVLGRSAENLAKLPGWLLPSKGGAEKTQQCSGRPESSSGSTRGPESLPGSWGSLLERYRVGYRAGLPGSSSCRALGAEGSAAGRGSVVGRCRVGALGLERAGCWLMGARGGCSRVGQFSILNSGCETRKRGTADLRLAFGCPFSQVCTLKFWASSVLDQDRPTRELQGRLLFDFAGVYQPL